MLWGIEKKNIYRTSEVMLRWFYLFVKLIKNKIKEEFYQNQAKRVLIW